MLANIYEVDGLLIKSGRRLVSLSAIELLNYAYALIVSDADSESRKKINAILEGRTGETGGIIVEDETLPESLQGQEMPSWWTDDHDPFADQHTIG